MFINLKKMYKFWNNYVKSNSWHSIHRLNTVGLISVFINQSILLLIISSFKFFLHLALSPDSTGHGLNVFKQSFKNRLFAFCATCIEEDHKKNLRKMLYFNLFNFFENQKNQTIGNKIRYNKFYEFLPKSSEIGHIWKP